MIRRAIPISLATIAAAAMTRSWQLSPWQFGSPGPGLLPFSASALLLIALIVMWRSSISGPETEAIDGARFAIYAASIAGFAILLPLIGTVPTILVVFILLLRSVDRHSWSLTIALSLGAAVGTVALFQKLLGVPLPHGLWW